MPDYEYVKTARKIEGRINDGTYPFQSRLPAMAELAAELEVAVMTVRRAIETLADPDREGGPVVRVLQGSGTYVIRRPLARKSMREHALACVVLSGHSAAR